MMRIILNDITQLYSWDEKYIVDEKSTCLNYKIDEVCGDFLSLYFVFESMNI